MRLEILTKLFYDPEGRKEQDKKDAEAAQRAKEEAEAAEKEAKAKEEKEKADPKQISARKPSAGGGAQKEEAPPELPPYNPIVPE